MRKSPSGPPTRGELSATGVISPLGAMVEGTVAWPGMVVVVVVGGVMAEVKE